MFLNLYGGSSVLRKHNFCNFLQPVEPVSEDYIVGHLEQSFPPAPHGLEPYFDSVFEFTLSVDCCASFIRANPELPITPRDYYLSKLFQFLFEVLVVAYRLDYREGGRGSSWRDFSTRSPTSYLTALGRSSSANSTVTQGFCHWNSCSAGFGSICLKTARCPLRARESLQRR